MKEQELQTGALVRHQDWGEGRLVALEDEGQRVVVDFRSKRGHSLSRGIALRSLTTLPDNGLEAMLLDNAEEPRSWVKDAPLKLLGTVLVDMGGSGKPQEIRNKLEGRVLHDVKWVTWWKRVQPSVKSSPHFRVGKGGLMTLVSDVNDVPREPASPLARRSTEAGSRQKPKESSADRLTNWYQWLLADAETPVPSHMFPAGILPALDAWPQRLVHRAAHRILSGVESALMERRTRSGHIAEVWLQATVRITDRWRQCREEGADDLYLGQLTLTAARLFEELPNEEGLQAIVSQLAAHSKVGGIARQILASELWRVLQVVPSGTRALLGALAEELDVEDRLGLWQDVLLNAFGGPQLDAGFSGVNRLLSMLSADDQARVIEKLILCSALDQVSRNDVLSYVSERVETSSGQYAFLKSLILSALLLGGEDTQSQISDQAAKSLDEVLTRSSENSADQSLSRLLAVTRERISESLEEEKRRQEAERTTYETRLAQAQREDERLRQQLHDMRVQSSQRREESTLDIRQDMLLVLGETLQLARQWQGGLQDLIRDVEAGLSLALQAGGAEEIGKAGDQVAFDPRLHQAPEETMPGASVNITAPGVLVRSSSSQDRVLLKAQVARSQEISS